MNLEVFVDVALAGVQRDIVPSSSTVYFGGDYLDILHPHLVVSDP
jgi:hypothetical protein